MSRVEGNENEYGPEASMSAYQIGSVSEMLHPDFQALLTYAEGALDQETCSRIARHLLICGGCSVELERIEMDLLPEMERPITIKERLRWMPVRLIGRIRTASSN